MIINDGSYAPSTTTAAPVVSSSVINPTAAARVKTQFSQAVDVTGIANGLITMIDSMVNGQPQQMRVNGKTMPPREKRWVR